MLIAKVPFDKGGLKKSEGCKDAPALFEKRLIKFDFFDIDVDNNNIELSNELIEKSIKSKGPNIVLGGDHSITYSSFKGYKSGRTGLIVFDAHPDMVNNFSPPTHEDYLRVLIEESIVDSKDVILVGLRNISDIEMEYLKEKGILYFDMKKINAMGLNEVIETIMENCMKFDKIYLSIDIDAIDPAFAPGTGYPEPGGFTSREFIDIINRMNHVNKPKCYDIVEVNPSRDVNNLTVNLAVKIIEEIK